MPQEFLRKDTTRQHWAEVYGQYVRFDPALLGEVSLHPKTLRVEIEVADGAERFKSYPEILDRVSEFYAENGVRIDYGKTRLEHDAVKVIILPEEEYVQRNPPLPPPETLFGSHSFLPPEILPSSTHILPHHGPGIDTIGSADFVERTLDIRFRDIDRYALSRDRDIVIKHYVNVIKHELGHLLGLAHTALSEYDDIDDRIGKSYNTMYGGSPEYIFDCCTKLTPLQVRQMHSFLGKGKVYDLIIDEGLIGYWGGMQAALRAKAMLK
jgi:hypothetical protein